MLLRRETSQEDSDLSILDQALVSILARERQAGTPFSRRRPVWVREMMDHIATLTDQAAMHEARILAGGI
jgi:hypothetical protein